MKFNFDAVIVSIQERESKGNRYFSVNLDQDGEIVTFSCTEDVAKQLRPNRYKPCQLTGQYTKGEFDGRVFTRIGVVGARVLEAKA